MRSSLRITVSVHCSLSTPSKQSTPPKHLNKSKNAEWKRNLGKWSVESVICGRKKFRRRKKIKTKIDLMFCWTDLYFRSKCVFNVLNIKSMPNFGIVEMDADWAYLSHSPKQKKIFVLFCFLQPIAFTFNWVHRRATYAQSQNSDQDQVPPSFTSRPIGLITNKFNLIGHTEQTTKNQHNSDSVGWSRCCAVLCVSHIVLWLILSSSIVAFDFGRSSCPSMEPFYFHLLIGWSTLHLHVPWDDPRLHGPHHPKNLKVNRKLLIFFGSRAGQRTTFIICCSQK